jgi:asparagine synthase (glutamine-hydrolysing)
MCGFVAILGADPTLHQRWGKKRLLQSIAHRGPDAEGEWQEGGVYLGHRRLSIIDLTTGDQPMQSWDGRYVIVFNGEIYNFPELRELLRARGATFRTRSDTEVILEAYREWGPAVVERLHGMFAFVIWDRRLGLAFGARDRIGIKPLCWAAVPGGLMLASTLEPFFLIESFRDIDLQSVRDLMVYDYILAPRTIFKNVQKLEPGCRFKWSLGETKPTIERYWSPPLSQDNLTPPDSEELESLLEQAVKRQMISDVPIGVFLSGGIDSSLIVALLARHSSRPVRTFSVGFREGNVDETPIAETVARQFGTDHSVLYGEVVGPEELLELLGRLDEPFCDPAFVPTYSLSEMTKRHVKVALSGDGGDEVFGGYPKYLYNENNHFRLPFSSWLPPVLRKTTWRPRGMERIYWRTLDPYERVQYDWVHYGDIPVFRKDLRQLLRTDYHEAAKIEDFFKPWQTKAQRYGKAFETDVVMRADLQTYLSENCLVKTDRASMLASLEVRVPYLDEIVLERILPLPANAKIHKRQLKALLMPIARCLLPKEVWNRPKQGFGVPYGIRLSGAWRPALEAALDWGETNLAIFDYPYLRRLQTLNEAGAGGLGMELWNPFVFLAWSMAHSLRL